MSTPQSRDWKGVPGDDFNTANLARDIALLPTPQTVDASGKPKDLGEDGRTLADHGANLRDVVVLLPTPAVNDMGAAYTPETWDEWTATMKAKHNNGNGHGKSLNVEAQRLLPTPTRRDHKDTEIHLLQTPSVADGTGGHGRRGGDRSEELLLKGQAEFMHGARWGEYEPAIRRWESITRPAPEPTKPNAKGTPKLSDEFDEWLMGLPKGWITDVPGVTWNEVLKACGNGVVWQQAAAAIRWLLGMRAAA